MQSEEIFAECTRKHLNTELTDSQIEANTQKIQEQAAQIENLQT